MNLTARKSATDEPVKPRPRMDSSPNFERPGVISNRNIFLEIVHSKLDSESNNFI